MSTRTAPGGSGWADPSPWSEEATAPSASSDRMGAARTSTSRSLSEISRSSDVPRNAARTILRRRFFSRTCRTCRPR